MITPAASGDQLSDADRGPIIDTHLHAFAFAGDVPGPGLPGAVPAAVGVGYGVNLGYDGTRP